MTISFWKFQTYTKMVGIILYASKDGTNDFIIIRANSQRVALYYENTLTNVKKKEKQIDNQNFVISEQWVLMTFIIEDTSEIRIY